MDVFIRADASLAIGQGHVMRCLSLADTLREQGAKCTFISREHTGNLCDHIEARGFAVRRLSAIKTGKVAQSQPKYASWLGASWSEDADQTLSAIDSAACRPHWLVVDHYGLDYRWESTLRPFVRRIMVIDDLADRPHDANLLLDQNLYGGMAERYAGLVPPACMQLLGPGYALLRREFVEARKNVRQRNGKVKRVFVFFGGSDVSNATGMALEVLGSAITGDVKVDVVIGDANPHRETIECLCNAMPGVRLHRQVSHMAELMAAADLALGAGGSATWERCALGLPAIVVSVADNQVAIANGVDEIGAHRHLGPFGNLSTERLAAAIADMQNTPAVLSKMSQAALALVDARGSERVMSNLKEFA